MIFPAFSSFSQTKNIEFGSTLKNIDMTRFLCYNFGGTKRRMELVTMNAVLALLVLIALLISLLVRLMITKPSLRAESYALPCQYCQAC